MHIRSSHKTRLDRNSFPSQLVSRDNFVKLLQIVSPPDFVRTTIKVLSPFPWTCRRDCLVIKTQNLVYFLVLLNWKRKTLKKESFVFCVVFSRSESWRLILWTICTWEKLDLLWRRSPSASWSVCRWCRWYRWQGRPEKRLLTTENIISGLCALLHTFREKNLCLLS